MNEDDLVSSYRRITAEALAEGYDILDQIKAHETLLNLIPDKKDLTVLNINAGAGKDAVMFEKLGCKVTACEQARTLRSIAQNAFPNSQVVWSGDSLPDLPLTKAKTQSFDIVTMVDILPYFNPKEREVSLSTAFSLVAKGGYLEVIYPLTPAKEFQYEIGPQEVSDYVGGLKEAAIMADRTVAAPDQARDLEGKKLHLRTIIFKRHI